MTFRHDKHHRRSIRLRGYDYSRAGAYFVTMCVQNRACLFGDVVDGQMVVNPLGRIVADEWIKTADIRNEIKLDEWVVMPNHFHGIVWIIHGTPTPGNGRGTARCRGDRPVAPTAGPQPRSLGAMVAGFKSTVTKRINQTRNTPGAGLWQRNYYEHIIRNDDELNHIRQYIIDNPLQWETDRENPNVEAVQRAATMKKDIEGVGA